jgi:hypothetical protein
MKAEGGTYLISARAAPARGGTAGANAIAYNEAQKFCVAKGQRAIVLTANERDVYQSAWSVSGGSGGAGRLRLAAPIFTSSANSGRDQTSATALAILRQRPVAHARRSAGRAVPGVPVVVAADRVRPLRQGADGQRGHARWRDRMLRDILARMRHDGCGGLAVKAELLTGIEGASSRPVRRIVLVDG